MAESASSPFVIAGDPEEQITNLCKVVETRNKHEPEFLQAFHEVVYLLKPLLLKEPKYITALSLMAEPERVISFRVPWVDDKGRMQVNRGFRVQYSSAIGPFKGGLRFHPSVNLSVMKFLAWEQIFKNSLTGLFLGGAKGGSDFDPKGKSNGEVQRFCQSFMTELSKYIGPNRDVPAGDIGVGAREIGFLFGHYRRTERVFDGALTGKDCKWGGSEGRPEATGYGCVYFLRELITAMNKGTIEGKVCTVSGSGNVAIYCGEKLLDLKAIVKTFSDSSGYILSKNDKGFTREQLLALQKMKESNPSSRVSEMTKLFKDIEFHAGKRPWEVPCEVAFPCATQNEIDENDAQMLAKNGCKFVVEGANMPSTEGAIKSFKSTGIILCPAKAANAGGVAVSGLEMCQNSMRVQWSREEVDERLQSIMKSIFEKCQTACKRLGMDPFDMALGANIAGFIKVADSVLEQGF